MSYATLYLAPRSGPIREFEKYQNAMRGAPMLWDSLGRKLVKGWSEAVHPMGSDDLFQELWNLPRKGIGSKEERIALLTTFDRVMVARENLSLVADAISVASESVGRSDPQFLDRWIVDPGNWPDMADGLRRIAQEPDCFAVCWQQTSVAEDLWWVYEDCECCGQSLEDGRSYDISRDKGHRFILNEYGLVPLRV